MAYEENEARTWVKVILSFLNAILPHIAPNLMVFDYAYLLNCHSQKLGSDIFHT